MGSASKNRPIGVIGNDEFGPAIAERLATCRVSTLYAALPGSSAPVYGEYLSPMSGDASGCAVVLAAIEDTETFRTLLTSPLKAATVGYAPISGSILVDLGARTPREFDALLEILEPRGIALADAALIGGTEAARDGRAQILLGGADAAVEIAETVVGLLGPVERTGPLGSAHAVAALMGYIEAAHAVAREEALALGAACGLTPDTIARVLADRGEHRMNVVQLARRADLARRIARDRTGGADIIDLAAAKQARAQRENR